MQQLELQKQIDNLSKIAKMQAELNDLDDERFAQVEAMLKQQNLLIEYIYKKLERIVNDQ